MLNMRNSTINVTITRVSATIIRIITEYIRNNSRKNRVSILFCPVPNFGRYAHGAGFNFISGMFCLWWVAVDVRAKGSDFGTPRGGYPRSSHHAGAGLVNAGTCGAQPPPIAHAGEWFRFFQVLDCSATVRAARVLQIWAAGVPIFYVGDISGRADFCAGSLTSSRSHVLGLRCVSGLIFSPRCGIMFLLRFG